MIIKLLPAQVSTYWGFISNHIDVKKQNVRNGLLASLMAGRSLAWMILKDEETKEVLGFFITTIGMKNFSGDRVLSVDYYAFNPEMEQAQIDRALAQLVEFAESDRCKEVVFPVVPIDVPKFEAAGASPTFAQYAIVIGG